MMRGFLRFISGWSENIPVASGSLLVPAQTLDIHP